MMAADVATLIPKSRRDSLVAWFELFMSGEAGPPESNTFKAKKIPIGRPSRSSAIARAGSACA